jgi:hypothetical protein
MASAELHSTDMVGALLGKRQRLAPSARKPRSQRMSATLEMVGGAGQLTDRSVWRGGPYSFVHHLLIGGKRGGR